MLSDEVRLLLLLRNFPFRLFFGSFVQARNERERATPATTFGREILTQRMALFVILRQENASKIGVTDEGDAHQVVDLTLHELGALPDTGHGGDLWCIFSHAGF